jgi:hypothetical protein
MLTKEEIKKKALNKYTAYLKSIINNDTYFPLEIKGNKQISTQEYSKAFEAFTTFYNNSKEKKGYGYSFEYEKTKKIKITRIYFETEEDYLKFIEKESQTNSFKNNIKTLRSTLDISDETLISNVSKISKWDVKFCTNIARISSFIINNPQSNLYQRELPIAVHTKFLEKNITVITSFISNFIPLKNVDNKYQKLGLLDKSFLIKIRSTSPFKIFDSKNNLSCSSETITLTPKEFEQFKHSSKTIFVVENETTFYNFPIKENELCLYSGGFSILSFKNNSYLRENSLFYFGDLDEHGFAIFSMFKDVYPNAKSIFMNMKCLMEFKKYKAEGKEYKGSLQNLNNEEETCFKYLKETNSRLEQEKIPTSYIKKELDHILNNRCN